MKRLLLSVVVAIIASLMFSCSAPQNAIIGNIEGLEKGDKVYLAVGYGTSTVVDSVVVEQDGNFQIETPITDATSKIYVVKKGEELDLGNSYLNLFLEGFSTMNIDGDISEDIEDLYYAKVTGGLYAMPDMSEHNKITDSAMVIQQKAIRKMNLLSSLRKNKDISKDSISIMNKEVMDLFNQSNGIFGMRDSLEISFRENNTDVAYSAYILHNDFEALDKGMTYYDSLYNVLTPRVRASIIGKELGEYISAIKATAVGAVAPDFKAVDIDGKNISLSDFKGKYVLLEFWGTWCGPCIVSIPHLVELYEKLKGEDFELLSIASRESSEENLLKMIKDKKMVWRHINDNEAVINSLYGINSWPSCFLIDPQGVIIEAGHPMSLAKKVEEIVLESRTK